MWLLKLSTGIPLFFIALEDFKERKVHWFLFPTLGILLGVLHYISIPYAKLVGYHILTNSILVTLILGILFLVTQVLRKKPFLDQSLGLGDILFFYAFALGFPTFTFVVLFATSLLFSLLVFLIIKKSRLDTVPLAGLMSVFLILILVCSLFVETPSLYSF